MHDNEDCLLNDLYLPVKKYIIKRVQSTQDAEDLLQTVLLKLWANYSKLRDKKNLMYWVYAITKNAIIDYYRSKKQDISMDELPENLSCIELEKETMKEEPMKEELHHCLHYMIQNLSAIDQQAIILTEYQKMSNKEYAATIGISISGAKSRVQRARLHLKAMMENCCYFERDHYGTVINYIQKSKTHHCC